jgi:hypothetical protein
MEKNGSIINREDGIDPKELEEYTLTNNGSIVGFPGAQATEENLMIAECDFLIPAAGEQQITSEIAHQIQAKVSSCEVHPLSPPSFCPPPPLSFPSLPPLLSEIPSLSVCPHR